MNTLTVTLEGMPEFRAWIDRLAASVGPSRTEPVLMAAAQIMTQRVRANARQINRVSGRLRVSPSTRLGTQYAFNQPRSAISFIRYRTSSAAPHAHLVEYGARGGQMPAQPFFRPAFDATRQQMLKLISDAVAKNIRRAAGQ